jgi:Spy/CpxP family protein refolding chaperone
MRGSRREGTVRKSLAFIIGVCLVTATAVMWAARQTPPAAGRGANPTVDDVMKAFRADLQSARADVVAKNVTLTAAQAAKFWPMFEQYQQEQNVIMDEQLKDIQKYVNTYETLDDAGALSLITARFDRDARMTALRQKWLSQFQTVLPVKLAVRVMQIDWRLSLATQIEIAARIPLVE